MEKFDNKFDNFYSDEKFDGLKDLYQNRIFTGEFYHDFLPFDIKFDTDVEKIENLKRSKLIPILINEYQLKFSDLRLSTSDKLPEWIKDNSIENTGGMFPIS